MPCRSRWSGARFRKTAHSGANSLVSSSWKLEHSQTTVASGSRSPASEASGVPTLPGDRHRPAGRAVDVADQLGRRRLAVGPGDGAEGVRERAPGELELAGHLDAALPRALDHGRLAGHAGALDHGLHLAEQLCSVHVQADFDAQLPQSFRLRRVPGVHPEDGLPRGGQHAGGGRARARQPDDQERARAAEAGADAPGNSGSHNHVRPRPPAPCAPPHPVRRPERASLRRGSTCARAAAPPPSRAPRRARPAGG